LCELDQQMIDDGHFTSRVRPWVGAADRTITLTLGLGSQLLLERPFESILIGNPDVVDVHNLTGSSVILEPLNIGASNLIFVDEKSIAITNIMILVYDASEISRVDGAEWNSRSLLPMADQHAAARERKPWTIFLEAAQNGKIALIHQLAAEALDVARASLLLLIRAAMSHGVSRNRDRQQDERQEALVQKFAHCVHSFTASDLGHTIDHGAGNAAHSITIAWSLSPDAGALRSSRTRGMAASARIIINLKSSM
jgi:hypothetical protein